jgi:ABC-2 type transport system permease protein
MICVFRIRPSIVWVFSPVIVFFLLLFSLGISYILSTAYVFFGDVKHLYSVLLTLWLYMSAIFYPVDQLGDFVKKIILCNPIFNYIDCMRSLVLDGTLPPTWEIIRIAVCGIAMYIIGYQIFKKNKNKIMQKI